MREGALLKIRFADGLIGYADCHPWHELGDLPLLQQLELLKTGMLTPLTQQSYRFARLDAEARDQKINLLTNLKIPPSHYLIRNLSKTNLEMIQEQGFSHLKVKLGRHLPEEIPQLIFLMNSSIGRQFKWRFDFNESLSLEAFNLFLNAMKPYLNSIDFIEDPFPFDITTWTAIQSQHGVTLACDRSSLKAIDHPEAAHVLILKPAIQDERPFIHLKSQRVVVTSYLDHPFGQTTAAYIAAKLGISSPCGLQSHFVYEPNPFSACLSWRTPHFQPAPGFGFGFDKLLQGLN